MGWIVDDWLLKLVVYYLLKKQDKKKTRNVDPLVY